jgi:hypothetical protein
MPARPRLRPRVEALLRDGTNGILDPPPSRRWIATRPRTNLVRKQVLERPVSHENCPSATRVTRRQLSLALHQGVRTTLLFTMSNAGRRGRRKSENRSQLPENAPGVCQSEFWLLISDLVSGAERAESVLACQA